MSFDPFGYFAVLGRLNQFGAQLGALEKRMSDLSDAIKAMTDEVAAAKGAQASATLLIQGLVSKLNAALANSADVNVALQNVRALTADLQSSVAPLAAAVAANPLPADPSPVLTTSPPSTTP